MAIPHRLQVSTQKFSCRWLHVLTPFIVSPQTYLLPSGLFTLHISSPYTSLHLTHLACINQSVIDSQCEANPSTLHHFKWLTLMLCNEDCGSLIVQTFTLPSSPYGTAPKNYFTPLMQLHFYTFQLGGYHSVFYTCGSTIQLHCLGLTLLFPLLS